ncbi:DUF6055 domain-containing protein [Pedobacter frigiditerrae]|uniref:DUF6055 domain-containing protein n=1 Tax=Pedobacter frigiditerrae TaxID=2530452 RepID=UPI0029300795|nr:DUF6055 domain-containing protein [Pedobacter frigiditerrae]
MINKYFYTKICVVLAVVLLNMASCKKNKSVEEVKPEVVGRTVYVPKELASMNLNSPTSIWSYSRSKQSDHFVVFWGAGYGALDPNSTDVPTEFRFNVDAVLAKAEECYEINVNKVKMAVVGNGKSNLDKYKMMIFVYYTTTYMANAAGYDDTIGALWVNPAIVKPPAGTFTHEVGHMFQYQVNCDLKGTSGFRHGYGGNNGNSFWESTAQWQSHQSYATDIFNITQFTAYINGYNKHVLHESQRYCNYFIHHYWANKHGVDFIGRLWRESRAPEDAIHTYMKLAKLNVEQLNDELYDASKRFVTWDIDNLRTYGANYIGKHTYGFTSVGNGVYRVAYNNCPQTTGYNVIPLTLPAAGTVVSIDFKGIPNTAGFNPVDASIAGWRYGYVALLTDGTRVYGDMAKGTTNKVSFTVPQNCSKLWFVVTGAPSQYMSTAWDDIATNDEQWPYEVKFTNSSII